MEGTAAFYEAVRARLTPLQIAANSTKVWYYFPFPLHVDAEVCRVTGFLRTG